MRRVVPVVCLGAILSGCAGRDRRLPPGEPPPIGRVSRRPTVPVGVQDVHIRGPFSAPRPRPELLEVTPAIGPTVVVPGPVARRERPGPPPDVRLGFRDLDHPNFQSPVR